MGIYTPTPGPGVSTQMSNVSVAAWILIFFLSRVETTGKELVIVRILLYFQSKNERFLPTFGS